MSRYIHTKDPSILEAWYYPKIKRQAGSVHIRLNPIKKIIKISKEISINIEIEIPQINLELK